MFFVKGGVCWAGSVTQDTARQAAVNWMTSVSGEGYSQDSILEMFTDAEMGETAYYVFNFEPEGWVIISASNRVHPVIGYSETGHYRPESRNPSFRGWMKNRGQQIRQARKRRISPSPETADLWQRLSSEHFGMKRIGSRTDSVPPLLETKWDQSQYYNEDCPLANNAPSYAGGHAFAGCVATAMAQIMKYHAYPAQGIGSNQYEDGVNREYEQIIPGSAYGRQEADFGNTVYNWAGMPDEIDASNDEIARLLYHCGVSVNMNFGPTWSSASTTTAAASLKKYFKYDDSISSFSKSDFTDAEWIDMLKTELNAGRPVLYRGSGAKGGHAFVCDGYQAGSYFHFNWGWGGYLDAYFYLASLTPGDDNYTEDQEGVFNIRPAVVPTLSFPYHQGFEAGSVPPEWSVSGAKASVSSGAAHTGIRSLMLGAADSGFYGENLAVLKINVPENGHLSFWAKRGFSPAACEWNHQKSYIKSEFGDSVLHTFFDGEFNDNSWQNFALDLSPWSNKVVKLCFELKKNCSYQEWMYIDDIQITGSANPVPEVSWHTAASTQTIKEDGGTATYAVHLNHASSQDITVPFTVSGTAAGGMDHNLAENGAITISAGSLSVTKTFQVLDDTSMESDETVILTLRPCVDATVGTPANLTITINDDDSIPPDSYEFNNSETQAYLLSPNFSGNTAVLKTANATIHNSTDQDYFKIDLPAGYDYTLSSRVHDSYSSTDGSSYTCNVQYACKTGAWSSDFDTQAPAFSVNDGGTVLFRVKAKNTGGLGSYGLEITISRQELPGPAILSVSPTSVQVSENHGWILFTIANTGEGTMTWTANTASSWLEPEIGGEILYVRHLYNSGGQRSGEVVITAPGAENSPQTVQITQAAGIYLPADQYEENDQETQAAVLSPGFSNNAAVIKTAGANFHQTQDSDYYTVSLPEGWDYTVSARVHDRFQSADGGDYTADVKFSFRLGTQWSEEYDTFASAIEVKGGQSLLYKLSPWAFGEMGTYALELNITRSSAAVPVLSVEPSVQNVSAVNGYAQFAVSNAGQGTMSWSAFTHEDWIFVDYDAQYIHVFCTDNDGTQRSGTVTVTSPEAGNSPHTVQVVQAAGTNHTADSYENNDTEASAALLPLNFSGYSVSFKASGTTFHDDTDTDYFRINLDDGYKYIISARLHDSYASTDGQDYSVDAKFQYKTGSAWSDQYDTDAPEIEVYTTASSGGEEILFKVEPYYQGQRGSYALDISIIRVPNGTTQPFLVVKPLFSEVSYPGGWCKFNVMNAGGGTLDWNAQGSADWLSTYKGSSGDIFYINYSYNFGPARSTSVTVSAPGALNSPQTLQIHQAAGMPVAADGYESNDTKSTAFFMPQIFVNEIASSGVENASLHSYDDRDFYALDLEPGYDYTLSARLHDRFSSSDGNSYTCDLDFYYYTPDGTRHGYYDTGSDDIYVQNGGTVYFEVEPWFYGEAGTYRFDVQIVRTAISGSKGDLNGSGDVDLEDAILALQVAAGISVFPVNLQADVNADGKIGLEESIYALRKSAGLP